MRNITKMLILACAIIFLTQCKKEIIKQPVGKLSDETIEVSLNVSNGDGAKTEITPSGVVSWNEGDRIYVVCNDVTGENGGYLGFLTAQNGGGASAYFTGTIKKTNQTHDFHFYYVGDNSFPEDGGNYIYDISVQNGKLDTDQGVAKKLQIMHFSKSITSGTTNLGTITMTSMMSIVKLKFIKSDASALATKLACYGAITKATIDTKSGTLTPGVPDVIDLNCVALKSGSTSESDEYYMALIPSPGEPENLETQNLTFANEVLGNVYITTTKMNKAVQPNKFYTSNGQSNGPAVTVTIDKKLEGALPGRFSVSATSNGTKKYIYFSQGNLRYFTSTDKTWRFADHQFDMVHTSDDNDVSDEYTESSEKWIDLFGFGTSGLTGNLTNHAICWQPWHSDGGESYNNKYYPYGSSSADLFTSPGTADWGYNLISNGGNIENSWYTLKNTEWEYIINGRSNASSRYGQGKVEIDGKSYVKGLIILPDLWENPQSCNPFVSGVSNWDLTDVTKTNIYSSVQWEDMQEAGAVFLPAAGFRYGKEIIRVSTECRYWSSVHHNSELNKAYHLYVKYNSSNPSSSITPQNYDQRCCGYSVRLVRNIE